VIKQKKPPSRTAPSIISNDLSVRGDLIAQGEVHIDGELHGTVRGNSITIGEKAYVEGYLKAEEVHVRGHVVGQICGCRVNFASTAHVEAEVVSQSLSVESGAFFQGTNHQSDDPLATEITADKRPPLILSNPLNFPDGGDLTTIDADDEPASAAKKKTAAG